MKIVKRFMKNVESHQQLGKDKLSYDEMSPHTYHNGCYENNKDTC